MRISDWSSDVCSSDLRVRAMVEPGRHVHLVLENENNDARLLQTYDAQWNDDAHNAIHVLLTGEHEGYYANYEDQPAQKLALVLAEGFDYQGEPKPSPISDVRSVGKVRSKSCGTRCTAEKKKQQ